MCQPDPNVVDYCIAGYINGAGQFASIALGDKVKDVAFPAAAVTLEPGRTVLPLIGSEAGRPVLMERTSHVSAEAKRTFKALLYGAKPERDFQFMKFHNSFSPGSCNSL
jgi:hypothetical protein